MPALAWMRHRVWVTAAHLSDQAADVAGRWLEDAMAQRAALADLETGRQVSLVLVDDEVHYEVSAHPVAAHAERPVPEPHSHPESTGSPCPDARLLAQEEGTREVWRFLANCLFIPFLLIAAALAALLMQQPPR